jgi:hypothetical protein
VNADRLLLTVPDCGGRSPLPIGITLSPKGVVRRRLRLAPRVRAPPEAGGSPVDSLRTARPMSPAFGLFSSPHARIEGVE